MADDLKLAAGEIVFAEHEPGDCAYIVRSGKIQISQVHEGRERLLAVIADGEIFGEMAILADAPRSATAIAQTDVVLARVGRDNFARVLAGNATVATKLLTLLSQRALAAFSQMRNLTIPDPVIRVANLLAVYFQKLADAHQPLKLKSDAKQLARLIGLPPKEVKTILEELARKKLILLGKDHLECLNLGTLTSLVALALRKQKAKGGK